MCEDEGNILQTQHFHFSHFVETTLWKDTCKHEMKSFEREISRYEFCNIKLIT